VAQNISRQGIILNEATYTDKKTAAGCSGGRLLFNRT